MHTIELSYPRSKKREYYTAPSKWNELSKKQLIQWANICLKGIAMEQAEKQAVKFLYNMNFTTFRILKVGQVLQLTDTLSFLWQRNQLNKWIIKHFWCGARKYYGPDDSLANLSIMEYRIAEIYYHKYIYTHAKKELILLVATLYRRKRKTLITDDIREDLTEYGISKRAKVFSSLPAQVLHAVLLNYEGCRNHIIQQYPRAFKTADSPENKREFFDLEKLIEALAGDKFGTFAETEKTNLHRFFRHIVSSIEKVEEQKAQLKAP